MRAIGWSLFLACSWTWCIGMYLPALVLRDYGWWGFLIFAVPNVIGASAFGYVLKNRAGSERFLEKHLPAARIFSLITIAFHMFWAPMVLLAHFGETALGSWAPAGIAALLVFAVGWWLGRFGSGVWRWLATLVYAASCLMLIATLATGDFTFALPESPLYPTWHVAFLALASCFGFALCPYLDLTFHRTLRESPSRHSFLGFGLTFSVMIFFTAVYFVTGFEALILVHILAQATFTVGVHLRELARVKPPARTAQRQAAAPPRVAGGAQLRALLRRVRPWALYLPLLGVLLALPLQTLGQREFVYQSFMVFYGLIFPLYVLVFALPRPIETRTERGFLRAGLAAVFSLPAFYLAFIEHVPQLLPYPFLLFGIWWIMRSRKEMRPASGTSGSASSSAAAAARGGGIEA